MRKKIVLIVVVLLAVSTIVSGLSYQWDGEDSKNETNDTILSDSGIMADNTLYVGGTGNNNFTKIQYAIDNATDGDTVFVYNDSSPYEENVIVNKSITLTGEDKDTTVINGTGSGNTVTVEVNYVEVQGFSITYGDSAGIYVGGNDANITNNNIYSNSEGIDFSGSDSNIISDNDLWDNDWGVDIYRSSYNVFRNNSVEVKDSEVGFYFASDSLVNDIDTSNTVNGVSVLLVAGKDNVTVEDVNAVLPEKVKATNYGLINIYNCDNVTVTNATTANHEYHGIYIQGDNTNGSVENSTSYNNSYAGIRLEGATDTEVSNNTFYGNYYRGIRLNDADQNHISNNLVYNNAIDGIYIYQSSNTTISSNVLKENGDDGLSSYDSDDNIIENNTISSNDGNGIDLDSNNGNSIYYNTISSNNLDGIVLRGSSNYNTLKNNTVHSNDEYGIYIDSSDNNTIYHNNFFDNTYNGYDNGVNTWNASYPEGGNYWGDYNGSDNYSGPNQDQSGSDGIGDTPYDIPGDSNQDEYPLMEPTDDIVRFELELDSPEESDGWQFISLPLIPYDKSVEEALKDIDGSYDKVMYYDASQDDWQTFVPDRDEHYNDLGTWNREMGLWIHMTTNDTLVIDGDKPVSTDITLQPGWNMVGYPSGTNRIASDVLPSEVSKIAVFNKYAPYNIEYIYDLSTEVLVTGRGYWVYNSADQEVQWTVDY